MRTMQMKTFGRILAVTRKFSAFTLVELIVVITVLAILATIGFVALSWYAVDAKDSAIKANVRSIQTAIVSEASLSNNSPRYYVVHDPDYALSGGIAYVDGTGNALTGGAWNEAGTNYSAGKPDFVKLRLNPDKFRISKNVTESLSTAKPANAAYDPATAIAAWADFTVTGGNRLGKRLVSFVQTAGVNPASKIASVAGNFPSTAVPNGYVTWLIRMEPGSANGLTWALMDGMKQETKAILMGIAWNDVSWRTWSDGSYADSCASYRFPSSGKDYGSSGSWTYWIDPDGNGGWAAFTAYCDMSGNGGGWTLVVKAQQSSNAHANASAVGTLTSPTQTTVAKLSDATITAIPKTMYRMSNSAQDFSVSVFFDTSDSFASTRQVANKASLTWSSPVWEWPFYDSMHRGFNTYQPAGWNFWRAWTNGGTYTGNAGTDSCRLGIGVTWGAGGWCGAWDAGTVWVK